MIAAMNIDPDQERHYNVRAAIPDHMAVFAQWRAMSDAYKTERPDARLDVDYGEGAGETLDFFPPEGGDVNAPAVLLIHGGYWQAMDKADNAFAARQLCAAGVGVAVVNHTLCPAASLEGIVGEIQRAALWLWRAAPELRVDRERLFVVGHSAGGHLAAMMMCADWAALNGDAPEALFAGGVAVSGLFDLGALVETTINAKVGLNAETARALSPVHKVPAASRAPFIAAVGGDESDGFHDQARALCEAWAVHGVTVEMLPLPGRHHFQAFEALAEPGSALLRRTLDMIG